MPSDIVYECPRLEKLNCVVSWNSVEESFGVKCPSLLKGHIMHVLYHGLSVIWPVNVIDNKTAFVTPQNTVFHKKPFFCPSGTEPSKTWFQDTSSHFCFRWRKAAKSRCQCPIARHFQAVAGLCFPTSLINPFNTWHFSRFRALNGAAVCWPILLTWLDIHSSAQRTQPDQMLNHGWKRIY